MALLLGILQFFAFQAWNYVIFVLFKLAILVWALVFMVIDVSFQDYGILSITCATTIVGSYCPWVDVVIFLAGLEQMKEVPDLVCDILTFLEVVDVLEQQTYSVISIKYYETNY